MDAVERRAFMKGAGLGALAFTVGGAEILLTPGEARARNVPFRLLTANEAETLEALGETLVPGARRAGIAHFVDQQISMPAEEALLEARILNVRPPYANFYRAAIGADRTRPASLTMAAGALRSSAAPEQRDFVGRCGRTRSTAGRARPAASSISCCASDAVDVVYGTVDGYAGARHPLHGAHRADREVVTWQRTKKSTSSSSVPARPARSMPRCWRRPARRSCCSSRGRTGRLRPRQLRLLGPADQARRRSVPARGQESVRLRLSGRLGRRRRGAALLRQFPAAAAERLQDQERARPRARLADLLQGRRALSTTRLRTTSACRATPRRRRSGGRRASPIRCRR